MALFCGIGWAESHHDVAIINDTATVVAKARIGDDAAGFARLLELLAEEAGDTAGNPILVGIETDHGLLVAALRATGRTIYAINPFSVSRYRARHQVSGTKSDAAGAVMLANIVGQDADAHRPLPDDTDLAQAVRVSRAQQDAVWARQQLGNRIRSLLTEFYPAALDAFAGQPDSGLARRDARTVLTAAPTPALAAKLTRARLRALLRKAGRRRNVDHNVDRLHGVFRSQRSRQPPIVQNAMGIQFSALPNQFEAACAAADDLAEAARSHCDRHPDATIITSFPGLGSLPGARVLPEIGDDRTRFTNPRGLKTYTGSAPITRANGRKTVVMHRHIKNRRLPAAGPTWALSSLKANPTAHRHFDTHRATRD